MELNVADLAEQREMTCELTCFTGFLFMREITRSKAFSECVSVLIAIGYSLTMDMNRKIMIDLSKDSPLLIKSVTPLRNRSERMQVSLQTAQQSMHKTLTLLLSLSMHFPLEKVEAVLDTRVRIYAYKQNTSLTFSASIMNLTSFIVSVSLILVYFLYKVDSRCNSCEESPHFSPRNVIRPIR